MNHASLRFILIQPVSVKNRPDPPGKTDYSVRFALIHKSKTTTSRAVFASLFFVIIDSSEILSQWVVLECQYLP